MTLLDMCAGPSAGSACLSFFCVPLRFKHVLFPVVEWKITCVDIFLTVTVDFSH